MRVRVAVVSSLLLAVLVAVMPSPSAESRTGGIAISLFRSPTRADIYTMNSRGGDVRRLTNGPGMAAFPAWSSDGKLIAFDWQGRGAASGIYVMKPDGSGRRFLATAPWGTPAWSPDGSKIAFWKDDRHGTPAGVYIVERDGHGLHLVTRRGSPLSPSWSPDGTKIAYSNITGVYVMNADGTGQHRLGAGYFPSWSRDGKTIAFLKSDAYHTSLGLVVHQPGVWVHTAPVWLMNANGSDPRRLHFRSWEDCELNWSPLAELAVSNPAGLFLLRPPNHSVTKLSGKDICGVAWQPRQRSGG